MSAKNVMHVNWKKENNYFQVSMKFPKVNINYFCYMRKVSSVLSADY